MYVRFNNLLYFSPKTLNRRGVAYFHLLDTDTSKILPSSFEVVLNGGCLEMMYAFWTLICYSTAAAKCLGTSHLYQIVIDCVYYDLDGDADHRAVVQFLHDQHWQFHRVFFTYWHVMHRLLFQMLFRSVSSILYRILLVLIKQAVLCLFL